MLGQPAFPVLWVDYGVLDAKVKRSKLLREEWEQREGAEGGREG